MKLRTFLTIGLLYSLAASICWATTTYKWRDENGNIVYSQTRPPAGQPFEIIKSRQSRSTTAAPAKKSGSNFLKDAEKRNKALAEEKKIASEEAKNRKLREDNCKAAKNNLRTYTVYRRIKNDKGEIVRLDDDERQRLIQQSKDAIKEFCD